MVSGIGQISSKLSHLRYYTGLNYRFISKGIPLREILLLKFPRVLPDAKKPPVLSVDVTDACDLKCLYCNNPLFPHPRTLMSDETVAHLLHRLEETPVNRVRIGGGEPTLHPRLPHILTELSQRTKLLTMVSNGQWKNPALAEEIAASGLSMLEISVDAGGKDMFEKSRPGASYGLLLNNLTQLRTAKRLLKSSMIIKLRLMLRPSTYHLKHKETAFLSKYSDFIHPQLVVKHPDSAYAEDVYLQPHIAENAIPDCTVAFKDLQVRPDGRVPICPAKGCALDEKDRIFLGNLKDNSLAELWNAPLLKDIRYAHRIRQGDILQMCRNCHYG